MEKIQAYNVKLKKKEVMNNAVIDRNGNRCFAKGTGTDKAVICVAIGLANAEAQIEAGNATKGKGW